MQMSRCLVADLGGLPMIDDQVKTSVLATLTCAVRQRLDNNRQELAAYLDPELARSCYRQVTQSVTELDSIAFNDEDMALIQEACRSIISVMPSWKAVFSIPLRWRRLVVDIASSSNPLIPQHIYLGHSSVSSPRLAEYLIHEVSHTWLGMIAEISPLAERGEPIHVLPSGTTGKEIIQVMYALTFAVSAIRFYRAKLFLDECTIDDGQRLSYLESYAAGCLRIVEPSGKLTLDGMLIVDSCRRFLFSSR